MGIFAGLDHDTPLSYGEFLDLRAHSPASPGSQPVDMNGDAFDFYVPDMPTSPRSRDDGAQEQKFVKLWNCSRCLFAENVVGRDMACKMCATAKHWVCQAIIEKMKHFGVCHFENEAQRTLCELCDAPKGWTDVFQ